MYLFLFSSRRRHTRCSRDWSSDVCSSDLQTRPCGIEAAYFNQSVGAPTYSGVFAAWCNLREARSEERRVGKDSRCEAAHALGHKKINSKYDGSAQSSESNR